MCNLLCVQLSYLHNSIASSQLCNMDKGREREREREREINRNVEREREMGERYMIKQYSEDNFADRKYTQSHTLIQTDKQTKINYKHTHSHKRTHTNQIRFQTQTFVIRFKGFNHTSTTMIVFASLPNFMLF